MLVTLAFVIMIELEISAAGECDLDKIPSLDRQLVTVPGLCGKVDRYHAIPCLETDQALFAWCETPGNWFKNGLELRSRTQLPGA